MKEVGERDGQNGSTAEQEVGSCGDMAVGVGKESEWVGREQLCG